MAKSRATGPRLYGGEGFRRGLIILLGQTQQVVAHVAEDGQMVNGFRQIFHDGLHLLIAEQVEEEMFQGGVFVAALASQLAAIFNDFL